VGPITITEQTSIVSAIEELDLEITGT
jgi:hypothetical protein